MPTRIKKQLYTTQHVFFYFFSTVLPFLIQNMQIIYA